MIRATIETILYLVAAGYVGYTLSLSTFMAPTLGKTDPFRGERPESRVLVAAVLGIVWPITAAAVLIMARVETSLAMPDSRSASRVLNRRLSTHDGAFTDG